MERILCVLIGYICGLFQTSYLYGKVHGIDIRNYGSGNAGTTNALRVIAVVIVHLIFGKSHPEMIRLLGMYAAAGTILGHNFPFYLNFKGGKGIAATAGLLLSFDLRLTLVAAIVFLAVFFLTHYVSLGSLLVSVVFVAGIII